MLEPDAAAAPAEPADRGAPRNRSRRARGWTARRRAAGSNEAPRRRGLGLQVAATVVGGAGLGLAAAAYLLVTSDSSGASLEHRFVAASATPTQQLHLRTREAPVELMAVTVSHKPTP